MHMRHLDSDLLRTFLAISDAGSITAGAARIERSQSATSLQIKQLEDIVGSPVFHRHGRGIALTIAGERLLHAARKVTTDLDQTLADLRGDGLTGTLRVGLPDDYGRAVLSHIVADFARSHPRASLEVHCALGTGFSAALRKGTLDLAVHEVPIVPPQSEVLRTDAIVWMSARGQNVENRDPLPVAVFDRDCWWRDAALASLKTLGRQYRIVFASESAVGVRAAVESGIAVGLLSETSATADLVGIPEMQSGLSTNLVLQTAPTARGPIVDAMGAAIRKAFVKPGEAH